MSLPSKPLNNWILTSRDARTRTTLPSEIYSLDISEPLTLIQMVIQRRGNTRADLLLHWQADFDTSVTDEVAENRGFDMYELGAQP